MNTAKQQETYNQKVLAYLNDPKNLQFKEMILKEIPQDINESGREQKILKEAKMKIRNAGIKIS